MNRIEVIIAPVVDYEVTTCARVRRVFAAAGYDLSTADAYLLWWMYSNDACAQWLMDEGMSDEQLVDALSPFFRPAVEECP